MRRPVEAFLDEVIEYLNTEVVPELYSERYYFDECEVRPRYNEESIVLRNLSFSEKNSEGHLQRVNDLLTATELRYEFQIHGEEVVGSWTEALAQFTVGAHDPDSDIPTVLKWEQTGETGSLKADERFDSDQEHIAEGVPAREAIELATQKQLFEIVPTFRERSGVTEIPSHTIQLFYNHESDVLSQLEPTEE